MITLSGGSLKGVMHMAMCQGYTDCGWATRRDGVWTVGGLKRPVNVSKIIDTRCTMLRPNVSFD